MLMDWEIPVPDRWASLPPAEVLQGLLLASGGAAALPMTIVTRVGMQTWPRIRGRGGTPFLLFRPAGQIQQCEQNDPDERVEHGAD